MCLIHLQCVHANLRNASFHEQMFLRAVISEFRRTGLEEATLGEIYTQLQTLYRTEGLSIN